MPILTLLLQRLAARLFPDVPVLTMPAPIETQARPVEPPAEPAPTGPQWHALPGNLIELAATGYGITLDVSPSKPLYTLRAPEGWVMAWGSDLPALKALAERHARERDEFVCRAEGWKP